MATYSDVRLPDGQTLRVEAVKAATGPTVRLVLLDGTGGTVWALNIGANAAGELELALNAIRRGVEMGISLARQEEP
jgi:hypothetical protein